MKIACAGDWVETPSGCSGVDEEDIDKDSIPLELVYENPFFRAAPRTLQKGRARMVCDAVMRDVVDCSMNDVFRLVRLAILVHRPGWQSILPGLWKRSKHLIRCELIEALEALIVVLAVDIEQDPHIVNFELSDFV